MLKFRNALVTAILIFASAAPVLADGDATAGEKVFKKCKACHLVGDNAKNRVGPHLNDLFGRTAGRIDGFRYSKAMISAGEGGLVWTAETLATFLEKPKEMVPRTKMSFSGLRKEKDREDIIAYLSQFSEGDSAAAAETHDEGAVPAAAETQTDSATSAQDYAMSSGPMALGRIAMPDEIKAWDIDIRPDGTGLPVGSGNVVDGEALFARACASCHGDFAEGRDRWPVLAGGHGTLMDERPVKTIGSYWPYLSTLYDYVRRAMPFGDARSLTDDDVYAITAYLLYMNEIVDDDEFVLSHKNFTEIRLPNEENFIADNRAEEPHWEANRDLCMSDCKPGPAEITMRARVLDVTPDAGKSESGSRID